MSNPLFVQTSEGWINLALVRQIEVANQNGGWMQFIFEGERGAWKCASLPLKEGERIMRQLMETEHILPG